MGKRERALLPAGLALKSAPSGKSYKWRDCGAYGMALSCCDRSHLIRGVSQDEQLAWWW